MEGKWRLDEDGEIWNCLKSWCGWVGGVTVKLEMQTICVALLA